MTSRDTVLSTVFFLDLVNEYQNTTQPLISVGVYEHKNESRRSVFQKKYDVVCLCNNICIFISFTVF